MYDSINSMAEDDFTLETDYEQVQFERNPTRTQLSTGGFVGFYFIFSKCGWGELAVFLSVSYFCWVLALDDDAAY